MEEKEKVIKVNALLEFKKIVISQNMILERVEKAEEKIRDYEEFNDFLFEVKEICRTDFEAEFQEWKAAKKQELVKKEEVEN